VHDASALSAAVDCARARYLRAGRLIALTGTNVATIRDTDLLDVDRISRIHFAKRLLPELDNSRFRHRVSLDRSH
jgi:hypothetical protein